MITAVDSSVLIDVLGSSAQFSQSSRAALRQCLTEGSLLASDVVWAEVGSNFPDNPTFSLAMSEMGLSFSPLTEEAAAVAARGWRHYRAAGGRRTRIVGDFLIGAHAAVCADRLLTRDRGFYRQYFSGLKILDPSSR
jgi:predicted nucleic acid-binding protein